MRVNILAAKTRLSQLVDRAQAGETVVITRHGKPVAQLIALEQPKQQRQLGLLSGRMHVPDDFDAPLPDELLDAFEGRG